MRPIFFCHIPKTAGTSLRNAIAENFDQSEICPNLDDIRQHGGLYPPTPYLLERIRTAEKPLRFVAGHYPISVARHMRNPVTVVILRNPVERAISVLKHRIHRGVLTEEEALASLDAGEFPAPPNEMTRYLSPGVPADDPGARLSAATANLARTSILGFVEELATVKEQLVAFGLTIPDMHKNSARVSLDLTERQRAVIGRVNALDVEIYSEATRITRRSARV